MQNRISTGIWSLVIWFSFAGMLCLQSSTVGLASPILDVSLKARQTGTSDPFVSSLSVTAGEVLDYEVTFIFDKTGAAFNTMSSW